MKQPIILIVLLCTSMSFSQESNNDLDSLRKNELKLNGLYLVAGAFDVTYERALNDESGLGLNLFLPFDEDIKDDIQYYISPYYRMYFGKKYAAGFFMEGFGMLNSVTDNTIWLCDTCNGDEFRKKIIDFALGIGFGGKWVTNRGFIGELNLGFGRNLFSSEQGEEMIGKAGITIGYRF